MIRWKQLSRNNVNPNRGPLFNKGKESFKTRKPAFSLEIGFSYNRVSNRSAEAVLRLTKTTPTIVGTIIFLFLICRDKTCSRDKACLVSTHKQSMLFYFRSVFKG